MEVPFDDLRLLAIAHPDNIGALGPLAEVDPRVLEIRLDEWAPRGGIYVIDRGMIARRFDQMMRDGSWFSSQLKRW